MQFPQEGSIPLTEKELRAEGITYCLDEIRAQYQCLEKARVRKKLRKLSLWLEGLALTQKLRLAIISNRNHTWPMGWTPARDLNGTIITFKCALIPLKPPINVSLIIVKRT